MVKAAPRRRTFNITSQPEAPQTTISTSRKESKRDTTKRVAEGRWDKFEVGLENVLKLFEHPENYEFTAGDFEAMEKRASEMTELLMEAIRNRGRPRRLKLQ